MSSGVGNRVCANLVTVTNTDTVSGSEVAVTNSDTVSGSDANGVDAMVTSVVADNVTARHAVAASHVVW